MSTFIYADKKTLTFIHQTAKVYRLDPALVCAIIEQESSWNPWAIRYEPGFYRRYIAPMVRRRQSKNKKPPRLIVPRGVSVMTEAHARAMSWGLMQVMGQTAREHGFKDRFLSALCLAPFGIDTGCRVLAAYLAEKHGDVRKGLLRWNGGGDPHYPDKVQRRVPKYKS